MAFGFWDALTLSTAMAVRDYYRDKEKQKSKQRNFYRKCYNEITDAAAGLVDVASDVSKKANPSYIPSEILSGSTTLPVYAFLKVLQKQGRPTTEQTKLMDIFFKFMKYPFAKHEFLAAVQNNNQTRQYIEDLAGISDSKSGTFWRLFFKAMYKTNSGEEPLSKVIEHFSSIVMRFAILGKPDSEVALPICEGFINAVHKQFVECRNLPEEDLDFIGEVSYIEHYQRMKTISRILADKSGDSDELDVELMIVYFCIGNIYEVIKQSTRSVSGKAEMLDYIMRSLEIELDVDGYEIIQQLQTGGSLKGLVSSLCELNPGERGGFWEAILIMGDKANQRDMSTNFFKECIGFLLGVESELSKKYHNSGFDESAWSYMSDVMNKIPDLFE